MLLIEVNTTRIKELVNLLKPYKNTLKTLYKRDPQYIAIGELLQTRTCSETVILVITNAIVSYQLITSGELYWFNFSKYFKENTSNKYLDLFKTFLSTYSPRLLAQKLNRVRKILESELVLELRKDPLKYCNKIAKLVEKIANTLKVSPFSKTILFAAKMYGYVCDLCSTEPNYWGLSIPLDYRNALLAMMSCIISISEPCKDTYMCSRILVTQKYFRIVQNAWSEVCRELGITCAHLDTFTWLLTGIIIKTQCNLEKAHSQLKNTLGIDLPRVLLEEFTKCGCL